MNIGTVFADRLNQLGTESAFLVSYQAKECANSGKAVYPFHLGDLNLPTPDNIVKAMNRAISDGKTGYCPPEGIPELRSAIAEDIGRKRNVEYSQENVAVQPGGKPTIGKFILALMNPGDEVLYPNPGYPIYESQIEFHGGKAVPFRYIENNSAFEIDIEQLKERITPKTKLLIYNNHHNPTGAVSSQEEMNMIAKIAIENDLWVLSDEAYFEVCYDGDAKSIVSIDGMKERSVILHTFSKKYAMTGWRIGAAVGSSEIIEIISKLNVNDESCTCHFMQWAMVEALKGTQEGTEKILNILKKRRDLIYQGLSQIDGVRVILPQAGFYVYPNVSDILKRKGIESVSKLQELTLKETGVAFCTRNHFGRPFNDESDDFIRFSFSGINEEDIVVGLEILKLFFEC